MPCRFRSFHLHRVTFFVNGYNKVNRHVTTITSYLDTRAKKANMNNNDNRFTDHKL